MYEKDNERETRDALVPRIYWKSARLLSSRGRANKCIVSNHLMCVCCNLFSYFNSGLFAFHFHFIRREIQLTK